MPVRFGEWLWWATLLAMTALNVAANLWILFLITSYLLLCETKALAHRPWHRRKIA